MGSDRAVARVRKNGSPGHHFRAEKCRRAEPFYALRRPSAGNAIRLEVTAREVSGDPGTKAATFDADAPAAGEMSHASFSGSGRESRRRTKRDQKLCIPSGLAETSEQPRHTLELWRLAPRLRRDLIFTCAVGRARVGIIICRCCVFRLIENDAYDFC